MRYLTTIPIKLKTSDGEVELKPGDTFKPKKEAAIKGLLAEGKVKPVRDILTEKYNELAEWLHNHDLTGEEIKEALPELYDAIQKTIDEMDSTFYAEDLSAFQDAIDRVKRLYQGAMVALKGEGLSYRIYSELLGCYLWVCETGEDMHFLKAKGIQEPIYTKHETAELRKLDKEGLKEVHKIKQVFKKSKVEKIEVRRQG